MNAPVTIELPTQRRAASVRTASFDETTNSIEVVWTTGAKVRRYSWRDDVYYDEELVVEAGSIRLDRLNSGAPLLNTHSDYDLADVIGSIVPGTAEIKDGKGIARVNLSVAEGHRDIVANIKAGIIKNISVGYRIHKVEKTETDDGSVPTWRIVDWEPLEISAVPVPADAGAQIRAGEKLFPAIVQSKGAGNMTEPTATPGELALERTRSATIADLGRQFGQTDLAAEAIRNGTALDEFRRVLNDRLVEEQDQNSIRSQIGANMHYAAPAGATDLETRRAAAMENAILHRVSPAEFKLENGAEAFVGLPLLELARSSIEARGVRTAGMSKMIVARTALEQRSGGFHTTTDFPTILANVTNRTLRAAYEAAPQTFRPLVRETTVSDFKPVSRIQLGEAPAFEKVNEHGEFKRGTIGEGSETYKIATYGKIIGLTRQAIVNDDLDAFGRLPRAFGMQAAQLESDLVWGSLLLNAAMGDNVALFHANHKNLATSGAAIGVDSVSAGRTAMATQTGLDGKTVLGLDPAYLIAPKALQTKAEQFLTTITPAKIDDVVPGSLQRLSLISDPRLDNGVHRPEIDIDVAGSATAWYLASTIAQTDILELAYLEGQRGVYTETRIGFDVDGVEIKVRLDVGTKPIDWRGLYKNPGV